MSSSQDDRSPPEPGLPAELARLVDGGHRAADLDRMYRALRADIERERGLRGWLRERSTGARLLAASALVAGLCGLVAVGFARRDLAEYPSQRLTPTLAAMGLLLAVSLVIALRPLQRPGLPGWAAPVAVTCSLLALAGLYLVAPLESHAALDAASVLSALACLGIGLALGVPIYGLIVVLDRGGARRALPIAAASGLAVNLVLHIHCPSRQSAHMMLGHFGAAALLLLAVGLWTRARD